MMMMMMMMISQVRLKKPIPAPKFYVFGGF